MTRKGKILVASMVVILTAGIFSAPGIFEFSTRTGLAALRKEGINVRAENLRGSLLGISAQKIHYTVPIPTGKKFPKHIPFPVTLSEVDATLSIRPLQHITPKIALVAQLLDGHMNASVTPGLQKTSIQATLDNADLSAHPQLRGLGLRKGNLTMSVSDLIVGNQHPSASQFTIGLHAMLFELRNLLPSIIPIEILEISDATIEGSLLDSGKLDITSISLVTNVATVKGRANGLLSEDLSIENLSGTVNIQMEGRDSHKFQSWLPLLTGGVLSSPRQSFSCTFFSVRCDSSAQVRLNSRQCLTYRCQ